MHVPLCSRAFFLFTHSPISIFSLHMCKVPRERSLFYEKSLHVLASHVFDYFGQNMGFYSYTIGIYALELFFLFTHTPFSIFSLYVRCRLKGGDTFPRKCFHVLASRVFDYFGQNMRLLYTLHTYIHVNTSFKRLC